MKYKLFTLAVAVLMIGLLGSCSDDGKRLDDLEQRTAGIEGDSIAGLNQQISAIEASIADLEAIRTSIQALTASREAQGADVTALQSADEAIGARIRGLEDYVGDLSRYAEKDWATAMFATLDQHNRTAEMLQALGVTVGKLDERLSAAIQEAGDILGAAIQTLSDRISAVETKVQAIDGQISAIEASIADLEAIRTSIQALAAAREAQGEDVTALKAADGMLAQKIEDLRDYVDNELKKYATTEWVDATFATLAKQKEILADIAKLKQDLKALDGKLDDAVTQLDGKLDGAVTQLRADLGEAIFGLESSMKAWVNGQLSAYYTAAQMDVKIAGLQSEIDALETDNETNKSKIEELESNLATLTQDLDEAKATIKTGYEAAIAKAISDYDGIITQTIQTKIDEVNATITALTGRLEALETAVGILTGRVDALEQMVQSVSITPAYSDGSVEVKDGILYLDIVVEPSEAVVGLTKDCLKVLVNEVKTKSVSVDTVAVTNLKVDAVKGTVTARADISTKLPTDNKALTIALNVKKGLSDYTTEFYPVTLSKESNVEITAGNDTTKVSIKEDADFPGLVSGTIKVNEGFKDNTTTTIKVSGIGTVIFDKDATTKIKSNAAQAGATSVSFKVENVTTTKHVPNADVVLEVTMKTVDETGTEVFCEEAANGIVTIQIPMDEDVVYVNSVTLVNEAGETIEGGVVPGSKSFEDGILTFKVMHFSEYAIDYVTRGEYKSVTGVSLDKTFETVEVGDSTKLIATITPENATNKELTWNSSDSTKVTVDEAGNVKAVAFGKATITVTTVDGSKTATCEVSVTETKTMVDILGTNTGMPESDNMTPPAKAWVNSTDPTCKAFIGKDGGKEYFVIKKEGQPSASLKLRMDDTFERIDDSTYEKAVTGVGTFTVTMAKGKFASYEFEAASGSDYAALNGTYSAPVSKEYVEIEAKYDGQNVSVRRWYRQSLAITASGEKAWKGGNGSAVKVPGTDEDVVVGDFFPWGTYAGFYGSGAGTDKGLLPYDSFTHKGCGDGSQIFSFKSGKKFDNANAPYYSGSAYTKYNAEDVKSTLDASDDVASIILGGTWRMPTSAEIVAMKAATYWKWDATDKGYYVFNPMEGDAGKINDETSNTYDKADALLFFPAVGMGHEDTLYSNDNSNTYYWSRTLSSNSAHAYALYIDKSEIHPDEDEITARSFGFAIRPVQDPEAEYVAATEVKLDITSKEINAKDSVQLKATVNPSNSTQKGVYWKSSNEKVATVDATGKVKGVGEGTATITATTVDGSKTATCTVKVTVKPTFKAVYDTNGDVNTLTFYYDKVDHSGAGITVYENGTANSLFDETKSGSSRWGYYGSINENIKSVVIDPSVADYSSLTSTAQMFYQMRNANSISGAEYLDVTNVTDMKYMFYDFGYNSTNLTTVPNVSKWNTGNVTNMQEMFSDYGYNSTGLAAVPDVSKWNTGKVTIMSAMFSYYGKNSTGLAAVPDVSKWNTGNVTAMANMFYNYGAQSSNINCVLDLSGWDLAKLSQTAGTIFLGFNPKTFEVTIPAKTGDKANEAGKWYYGDGNSAIEPPTGKTFTLSVIPAGALKGVFTVNAEGKKVYFSQGNLYHDGSAFKFETNQYDVINSREASHVGHFFWSKNASVAYAASYSESGTSSSDVFFTNATSQTANPDFTVNGEKGTYRNLSTEEWQYLFNTSSRMINGKPCYTNKVTTHGGIVIEKTRYHGIFIYPDNYNGEEVSQDMTWDQINAAGIVFLPQGGFMQTSVFNVGKNSSYWTSSSTTDAKNAFYMNLSKDPIKIAVPAERGVGFSVRLVADVPAAK